MSTPTFDTEHWQYVDADGTVQRLDEWELVAALSSSELAPETYLWRSGWAEWLHAYEVQELRSALPPGAARPPREPKRQPRFKEAPIPPARLSIVSSPPPAPSARKARRPPTAPPPPNRSKARAVIRNSALAPPEPTRAPIPTLAEISAPSATTTLRPPRAVPPPPRGVPPEPRTSDPGPRKQVDTPIPELVPEIALNRTAQLSEVAIAEKTPPPGSGAPLAEKTPLPGSASAGPIVGALAQTVRERSASLIGLSNSERSRATQPGLRRLHAAAERASRLQTLVIALGAATAALLAIVIGLLLTRSAPKPESSTAQAAEPEPPPPTGPCTVSGAALRIAPSYLMTIPPYAARVPSGDRVAIGLAANPSLALGLTVDPETLDSASSFSHRAKAPISAVVPLTRGGKLRFVDDRSGGSMRFTRTVDQASPFKIGVIKAGFAVQKAAAPPKLLWPLQSQDISEPRLAETDHGLAVTFRQGGQSGQIMLGWLTTKGMKQTELSKIQGAKFVGTPTVAANEEEVLVAFAARTEKTATWGIYLGRAPHGQVPSSTRPFTPPPGGPGGMAISPAVVGLPGGRWLLQWTEGSPGAFQVRALTLDQKLTAIGTPLDISPPKLNAGQGVLWIGQQQGLALFAVTTDKNQELWGASLKCP